MALQGLSARLSALDASSVDAAAAAECQSGDLKGSVELCSLAVSWVWERSGAVGANGLGHDRG